MCLFIVIHIQNTFPIKFCPAYVRLPRRTTGDLAKSFTSNFLLLHKIDSAAESEIETFGEYGCWYRTSYFKLSCFDYFLNMTNCEFSLLYLSLY